MSQPLPFSAARKRPALVAFVLVLALLGAVLSALGQASSARAEGGTASLSGTVTGASSGLQGVFVQIISQDGQYEDNASTAQDGTYSFATIPAGSYTLDFQPAQGTNFLEQWWQGKPTQSTANYFTIVDGQTLTGFDAGLLPGATITGTVDGADALGVGLADVNVSVQSLDGSAGGQGVTDADGNYSVVGLPASTYDVQFQPQDNVHVAQWWNNKPTFATAVDVAVSSAGTVSGIDAHLAVGATISGTVDSAGSPAVPLAGAEVSATSIDELTNARATTDASGNYTITGLPDGTYTVEFDGPDGTNYGTTLWQNATTFQTATPVTLSSNHSAAGIDAVLSPGATISGAVYAPGSPKVGLADVEVNIFSTSGGWSVGSANTDRHGRYHVANLAAGSYSVQFVPMPDSNAAIEWWGGSFIETGAKTVTVSAGQTATNISQQLIVGSAISGTVVDAGTPTTPDSNVEVVLWPSDQVPGNQFFPPLEAFTDASGNYSFANIGPGTYTVLFGEEGPNFESQWWRNKPTQAKATKLVVKLAKPSTGVNATLAPAVITAGTPRIVGQARVGITLTVKPGVWKPRSVIFTYQWLRNGVAISKATGSTYLLTSADVGAKLSAQVTGEIPAAESQGQQEVVTSAPTHKVRA